MGEVLARGARSLASVALHLVSTAGLGSARVVATWGMLRRVLRCHVRSWDDVNASSTIQGAVQAEGVKKRESL
jgi:hypothetical protein